MAGNVANARIWLKADGYRAPLGTTAPTDASTALPAAWKAFGLLSDDDGISESRDEDSDDKYAYGNILIRTVRSKHKRQIKVTVLEDNATVFGILNPGSTAVTATTVTTRTVKVPGSDIGAYLFEAHDGTINKRKCIPRGEVVEVGDEQWTDSDLVARELTINIYPDSTGVLYYEITDDPQAIAS